MIICVGLSLTSDKFFTIANLFNLLNTSSTNLIFAVGLLVVLIAGGIDISFAVAASVVQYVVAVALIKIGGGDWLIGISFAAIAGIALGAINAALIYYFRIISIVVTIATFNIFFGLLMFFTRGVSIYNLPEWWTHRTMLIEFQQANGNWTGLALPVGIMAICVVATWVLIRHTSIGRQLYAFGDNPEGARRLGINIAAMHFIAFGWLGPDGGHRRAGAGALRAGGGAQRADRPRARRARRGRPRRRAPWRRARYGAGLHPRRVSRLGDAERAQPPRHFALCVQDDHRRDHPHRHHPVQRTARPDVRRNAASGAAT